MLENIPTLERKLDPKHTAVLVIDVQNGSCHIDGVAAPDRFSTSMIPPMKATLSLFLKEARAAGTLIVYVRAIHDPVYLSPPYAEQLQKQGTYGKTVSHSWEADYCDEIRPTGSPREVEMIKHRYNAFHGTELDLLLRSNDIKTLVMTGFATGGCVYTTATDGLFRDYYVVMAEGSLADRDDEAHRVFLRRFQWAYGDVVPSSKIAEIWKGHTSKLSPPIDISSVAN